MKNNLSSGEKFFIVSELAPKGDLFEFLNMATKFSEKICKQIFFQLIQAVYYIHTKGVAHRDLKLENIFLDNNLKLKVADFGLMKIFSGENA